MITSTSSSQVKHVLLLQKKAKARRESQEFVVEGVKMVSEAPKDRVVKVYISETYDKNNSEFKNGLGISYDKIEIVSDSVFMHMSDTQTPQGVMAIIKMRTYNIEETLTDKALIIGVENLQDPGNLGTIVRMGEGAGITGVVMSTNTVDIYNPKTIRSTMGSIYRVPFLYVDDFAKVMSDIQSQGANVYAAHLDGSMEYTEPDYTKKTVFLIGNEGNGLTDAAVKAASDLIKIPMEGEVESLNAAIACTVLTYEAMRQRRK
ncbi:MAG: RNA methyltransferase [Lachnospira sp.]|nr:RNA methyltransferase [Lachnospira sp.]